MHTHSHVHTHIHNYTYTLTHINILKHIHTFIHLHVIKPHKKQQFCQIILSLATHSFRKICNETTQISTFSIQFFLVCVCSYVYQKSINIRIKRTQYSLYMNINLTRLLRTELCPFQNIYGGALTLRTSV